MSPKLSHGQVARLSLPESRNCTAVGLRADVCVCFRVDGGMISQRNVMLEMWRADSKTTRLANSCVQKLQAPKDMRRFGLAFEEDGQWMLRSSTRHSSFTKFTRFHLHAEHDLWQSCYISVLIPRPLQLSLSLTHSLTHSLSLSLSLSLSRSLSLSLSLSLALSGSLSLSLSAYLFLAVSLTLMFSLSLPLILLATRAYYRKACFVMVAQKFRNSFFLMRVTISGTRTLEQHPYMYIYIWQAICVYILYI